MLSHKPSSLPSVLAQIRADVLPFALFRAANTPVKPAQSAISPYSVLCFNLACKLLINP